jgi:hypothetical protein
MITRLPAEAFALFWKVTLDGRYAPRLRMDVMLSSWRQA